MFLSFIRTILPSSMLCENTRKSLNLQIWGWHISRVATVREKVWKMKFFPGQGKVREFEFESGKIAKSEKVREFQNFLKRDGLWQCINVLKEFETRGPLVL